jgi:hypothetical protein
MKKLITFLPLVFTMITQAQTTLEKTSEQFKNKEFVWNVNNNGHKVGQFWPIHGLNLVTKDTDPQSFNGTTDITTIQRNLAAVATAPDGMTGGSVGNYQLQGKCLSHGRSCGDGFVYQYGVVCVSSNGYSIRFTHASDDDFDSLYNKCKNNNATLFFLPSVYRNGAYLSSEKTIDKVLVRRETPSGEQIGVVLFDQMITYNRARGIILGLDRASKSKTTHVYVLDGGGIWGQSSKETNGITQTIGTRDPKSVTNYLVFY